MNDLLLAYMFGEKFGRKYNRFWRKFMMYFLILLLCILGIGAFLLADYLVSAVAFILMPISWLILNFILKKLD